MIALFAWGFLALMVGTYIGEAGIGEDVRLWVSVGVLAAMTVSLGWNGSRGGGSQ